MLGAALVVLRHDGGTTIVAAPEAEEGAIVLASAPLEGGEDAVTAIASSMPLSRRRTPDKTVRARSGTAVKGMVLRLGARGLGMLSQQDTLDLLKEGEEASEIVLPVGSRIGRVWAKVAASDGLTVLLAFGERIRARLKVTRIVSGNGQHTLAAATGVKYSPWPVQAAPCWFVAESVEVVDASDRDFLFNHGGEWQPGFTRGQASWIGFRYEQD
jgi:hypothetical protein